jgi:hypothetical protein
VGLWEKFMGFDIKVRVLNLLNDQERKRLNFFDKKSIRNDEAKRQFERALEKDGKVSSTLLGDRCPAKLTEREQLPLHSSNPPANNPLNVTSPWLIREICKAYT